MHTIINVDEIVPKMIWFTNASTNDHVLLNKLRLDSNTIYVVDKVISGFSSGKTVIIISDKYEDIKHKILVDLNRGGTFLLGEGMYSKKEKKIIYTTLSRKQLPQLIHYVHEIDSNAFISILDAGEVFGEGFS